MSKLEEFEKALKELFEMHVEDGVLEEVIA